MSELQLANPNPHQPYSSGGEQPVVVEEARRSPQAQAEVERIGQADTYLILDRDIELFDWLDDQRDLKLCGYVTGSTGSGLLKACKFYQMKHVKRRGALLQIPATVIYAELSQPGHPKNLYQDILKEIGHPLAEFGGLRELRARAWGTLKDYGVKLLMIGNSDYLKLTAFNELIDLFGKLRISIVLVGTDTLTEDLNRLGSRYRRVHNSFLESHEFLDLKLEDLREIISHWEDQVLQGSNRLNLAHIDEVCRFLELKSKGRIDTVYELLRQIAVLRIDNPMFQLNHKSLTAEFRNRNLPNNKTKG